MWGGMVMMDLDDCCLGNLGVLGSDGGNGDDSMLQYSLNDVRYTVS